MATDRTEQTLAVKIVQKLSVQLWIYHTLHERPCGRSGSYVTNVGGRLKQLGDNNDLFTLALPSWDGTF